MLKTLFQRGLSQLLRLREKRVDLGRASFYLGLWNKILFADTDFQLRNLVMIRWVRNKLSSRET
jgi:hypothetical protein